MISANIPNPIRKAIYQRDGYACLCGDNRHLHIHHVLPRSSGGGNDPSNLVTLCRYCHSVAHGVYLEPAAEGGISPDDVEQAAVEYLSDMYLYDYDPHRERDYSDPAEVNAVLDRIDLILREQGRGGLW